MDVVVRARNFRLTEPLKAYAMRRLWFAAGVFGGRIDGVDLRLADVNGPRGGIDKACVIAASLRSGGRVLASGIDANAYDAVDRAAARLRTVLVRSLRRRRGRRRRLRFG